MTRRTAASSIALFLSCSLATMLSGCSDPNGLFGQGTSIDETAASRPSLPTYAKGSWYAFNDGSRDIVVDTEAGSFETYPISCVLRSRGNTNKLLGTRLWHYAPAVGHYVRREKIDNLGTREIQELIARG